MTGTNGWSKDKALIEFRQETHEKQIEIIYDRLYDLHAEIAALKVKSGIWGVIGGAIPTAITLIVALIVWLLKS